MFGGLGKKLSSGLHKVAAKMKHKSKEEDKKKEQKTHLTLESSNSNPRKKKTPKGEERTQHDGEGKDTGKSPKPATTQRTDGTVSPHGKSPHMISPLVASPAGSMEKMDDSKGADHSTSENAAATAKSFKDSGVTEHFAAFLDQIDAKGWAKIADEFKEGFRTNAEVNRTTRYVITFNSPPDGDFYDANNVELPGAGVKFIAAAVPDTSVTNKETFWRMVYDISQTTPAIVIFVENFVDVDGKESKEKPFVPWKQGDTKDYGKMWISNKKTVEDGSKQAILEVLPEGCSNSIITRFIQVFKWPETVLGDVDGSARCSAVHAVRLIKEEKGPVLVVCNNGCGKSAMFILLHAIVTRLNSRQKVSMPDMLRTIRSDRWGAIQTVEQYLTLHLLILDYIRTKLPRLKDRSSVMRKGLHSYVEGMYANNKKATPKKN